VRRDGGLTLRDRAAIKRTRASLAANPPVTGSRQVLVRVSPDGTTALVIVNLNPRGKDNLLKSSVSTSPGYEALRDHVGFYPGRVDAAWSDDERVQAQQGDFYGGGSPPT
jgi:hypothetical protein